MKKVLLTGVIVMFFCMIMSGISFAGPMEDLEDLKHKPRSGSEIVDSRRIREAAADRILKAAPTYTPEERKMVIESLMKMAGEKEILPRGKNEVYFPYHDSKHLSIILLGELKVEEAIPLLIENLTYKNPDPFLTVTRAMLDQLYPAVGALASIGRPANPKVKELLDTTNDPLIKKLCQRIIFMVEWVEEHSHSGPEN